MFDGVVLNQLTKIEIIICKFDMLFDVCIKSVFDWAAATVVLQQRFVFFQENFKLNFTV